MLRFVPKSKFFTRDISSKGMDILALSGPTGYVVPKNS